MIYGSIQVSAANTARDGTGSMMPVLSVGSRGIDITTLRGRAIVTTTAGMLRWFLEFNGSKQLIWEMVVTAITVGAAVEAWADADTFGPDLPNGQLYLPPASTLWVATHNAEAINAFAVGEYET